MYNDANNDKIYNLRVSFQNVCSVRSDDQVM